MENNLLNDTPVNATDGSNSPSIDVKVPSNRKGDFRRQKMIKQFAQTLICIVLICVVSFFKDAMKHEKLKKKEIAEMQAKVAHQNYLIERERFLEKHREFLKTFLEYQDHCNKIHPLIIKNPGCMQEVKTRQDNCKRCNPYVKKQSVTKIVPGDRAPLDFALIYVFLAILLFLFARAVIDVSKEFNAPHSESTEKLSLHDYASISTCNSRRSSVNPMLKNGSKFSRFSFSLSFDPHQALGSDANSNRTNSPGPKRSSFSSSADRRCSASGSMVHHILKDSIDEMGRRPSVESFTEEDLGCSGNTPETKKHIRLIRR